MCCKKYQCICVSSYLEFVISFSVFTLFCFYYNYYSSPSDKHIDETLITMYAMQLLESVNGNIPKAVDLLRGQKRSASPDFSESDSSEESMEKFKKTKLQ